MIVRDEIQAPLLCLSDFTGAQPAAMLALWQHGTGMQTSPVPVIAPSSVHLHPISKSGASVGPSARVGIGLVPLRAYKAIGYSSPSQMMIAFEESAFEQIKSSYAYVHFCLGNLTGLATENSRGLRLAREACDDDRRFISLLELYGLVGCRQCVRIALNHLESAKSAVCDMKGCSQGSMHTTCQGVDAFALKDVRTLTRRACSNTPHKRQALATLLRSGRDLVEALWDYS